MTEKCSIIFSYDSPTIAHVIGVIYKYGDPMDPNADRSLFRINTYYVLTESSGTIVAYSRDLKELQAWQLLHGYEVTALEDITS